LLKRRSDEHPFKVMVVDKTVVVVADGGDSVRGEP
jgi:hypothetical protein